MGCNFVDLCSNQVLVWVCNIQLGLLLQHTSFKISSVRASNAMDQMLICCIAVFQYCSIICWCGASANAFATHHIAWLTICKSLALINGRLFHIQSSMSLPIVNTRRMMSEWPNRWMLRLQQTIDRGVDTACGCYSHCLSLWLLPVARIRGGFVMIAQASRSGMGVGRVSWPLTGVGVLAMPDVRQDTTRRVESACEVPPGPGVPRLLVPGVAVGLFIDRRRVADGVKVPHWVISAMPELFSEDEGVEFWPWIVKAMELPPWEVSLSPAGAGMCLLAGGSWGFPKCLHCCCFWTICTTGVVSGWELLEGIVWYKCSTLKM